MLLARRVLFVALTVALATYAIDCVGLTTPERAMQCCNSMRCPPHHHHGHQDCCKTMPTTNVDFGQPLSFQGVSHSPVVFALPILLSEPFRNEDSERMVAEISHAPPIFCSPPVLPLRI